VSVTLGIDIGTSGTRTLAIDEEGRVLATASAEYPCDHPRPGWSEQNPEHWWTATVQTVGDVLDQAGLNPDEIAGVGLSGQMHGSVFLDSNGEVVRPALLWNDQRTVAECREIEERAGGREQLIRLVANPALTGFTAPKLLWLRNHEPENWDRVRQVLLPKDYIRYRLTGTYATEVSDASGTLLLDVANRRWSQELLSKLQIDPALLPPCYESPEVSAQVSGIGGSAVGLAEGTPVVGGGGDQPAGAVGNGIVRPGAVAATMGTSGVVFAHTQELGFDPLGRLQRGCHAVPGAWHAMGVVLSAGGSLQWFRNELGKAEMSVARKAGVDPYEILSDEAVLAGPGAEGLFFLPYLTGERTPHFDPDAKGAWIGLTVRHGRSHMIRSIMEGATFAMRDSLELIREMGAAIEQVRSRGEGREAHSGGRFRRIFMGTTCTPLNPPKDQHLGPRFLRRSGPVGTPRCPRLAMPRLGSTQARQRTLESCPSTIALTRSTDNSTKICTRLSARSVSSSSRHFPDQHRELNTWPVRRRTALRPLPNMGKGLAQSLWMAATRVHPPFGPRDASFSDSRS